MAGLHRSFCASSLSGWREAFRCCSCARICSEGDHGPTHDWIAAPSLSTISSGFPRLRAGEPEPCPQHRETHYISRDECGSGFGVGAVHSLRQRLIEPSMQRRRKDWRCNGTADRAQENSNSSNVPGPFANSAEKMAGNPFSQPLDRAFERGARAEASFGDLS